MIAEQKTLTDAVLAGGALTSPIWLEYISLYGQALTMVLGLALLVITIGLRIREWRKKDGKANTD